MNVNEKMNQRLKELGINLNDTDLSNVDDAELEALIGEARRLVVPLMIKHSGDVYNVPSILSMALAYSMVGTLKPDTTQEKAEKIIADMAPMIAAGYIIMRDDFHKFLKNKVGIDITKI